MDDPPSHGLPSRDPSPDDLPSDTLAFDVSLVLNLHRSAVHVRRTLWSLAEAARHGRGEGLRTELVMVLDNPGADLLAWVEAAELGAFDGAQRVTVANGSLGLSRNAGLLAARGRIVIFCDEDDLVSFTTVAGFHAAAIAAGPDAIVHVEHALTFGETHGLRRFVGTDVLSPLAFITGHPFTSQIGLHRSASERLSYADVRLGPGYAFEDWDFNARALAAGFRFVVAPRTVLFYRKRLSGLHGRADAISAGQPPPNPLFRPPVFLERCAAALRDYARAGQPPARHEGLVAEFLADPLHLAIVKAANEIEPAVDLEAIRHGEAGANTDCGLRRGAAYGRACERIGATSYTDVVLLPFMAKGGGEKYILNVLNGIAALEPQSRVLVLTGQPHGQHDWLSFLPARSTFIDLVALDPDLNGEDIDVLTLRLIEATAPAARVHLKTCAYAHSFLARFGQLRPTNRFIYYRFSDPIVEIGGTWFTRGITFDFLSDHAGLLTHVLTDHHRVVAHDRARLEPASRIRDALYTRCDPLTTPEAVVARGSVFRHRLLWAARLDREKRPDLLLRIARRLAECLPAVSIDVYGGPVLDVFDPAAFRGQPNIRYRGSYDSFGALEHEAYDALLYTTLYDGLPNIVLEAMSAALPVIAPALGGIGEAVIDGCTGFLLPSDADDDALVARYVEALVAFYARPANFVDLRLNALEHIGRHHAGPEFLRRLSRILFREPTEPA